IAFRALREGLLPSAAGSACSVVMSGSAFRQIHGLRGWPEGAAFGFVQLEISFPDLSGMSISFVIGITEIGTADEPASGRRCSEFSGTDEAVVPSRDNGLRG